MKRLYSLTFFLILFCSPNIILATEPPTILSGEFCGSGMISLFAFGNDVGETIKWYHVNTGGTYFLILKSEQDIKTARIIYQ